MVRKRFALGACLALWSAGPASADMLDPGAHGASEGPRYWVNRFVLEFAEARPESLDVVELESMYFALGVATDGYVGPRRGGRNVWFRLGEMSEQEAVPIYSSGLRELAEQLVAQLCSRGWVGAYVAPDPTDIDPLTGRDLRAAGRDELRLRIYLRP